MKIPHFIKGVAGGKAKFFMLVTGKRAFQPSQNSIEFMLRLPAGVTAVSMKVGKVGALCRGLVPVGLGPFAHG